MRFINCLVASAIIFPAAACSETEDPVTPVAAGYAVPGAPPTGAVDAMVRNAPASEFHEENDDSEFAYSYPAVAARLAGLAGWLDNDRAKKRDALISAARRDREVTMRENIPFRSHSHVQKWQRFADTPRFLSLSSDTATYSGGAHGMSSFDTLLWDRRRSQVLRPLDLFVSGEAFDAVMTAPFCAAIKRAKTARGAEANEGAKTLFGQCPPPSTQTIWLGSSTGRKFDRMTIAVAPYEVGPYAEGSYAVSLRVTPALLGAVKPSFGREFSIPAESKGEKDDQTAPGRQDR